MTEVSRLTDEELSAFAAYARQTGDVPLAALVDELQARRGAAVKPWAIVVLAPGLAAMLSSLLAARRGPALVVAPDRTLLLTDAPISGCRLETYDPAAPLDLRRILKTNGIGT